MQIIVNLITVQYWDSLPSRDFVVVAIEDSLLNPIPFLESRIISVPVYFIPLRKPLSYYARAVRINHKSLEEVWVF
jgi:hypothetical protein